MRVGLDFVGARHGQKTGATQSTESGRINTIAHQQLAALHAAVLDTLASAAPMQQQLDTLCVLPPSILPDTVAIVLLADLGGEAARVRVLAAPKVLPHSLETLTQPADASNPWLILCQDPSPRFVTTTARSRAPRDLVHSLRQLGMNTLWSGPIKSDTGQVMGAFMLLHPEVRPSSEVARRVAAIGGISAGLMIDRSRRRETTSALEAALDATTDTILLATPEGVVYWVNPAFTAMTGYNREELIGARPSLLHGPDTSLEARAQIRYALRHGQAFRGEILYYRKDGVTFWNDVTISPIHDTQGSLLGFFGIHRNTTETHELRDQIQRMAYSDPLTALPNRHALEISLRKALVNSRLHTTRVAVGVIDLDHFKPINDTWGHAAGDSLLQEFARRLEARVAGRGMAARVGGDEFVVVLDSLTSASDLPALLTHLHGTIELPFPMPKDHQIHMGMSMGVTVFPDDDADEDLLLRHADAALYHTKAHRVGRTQWWHQWQPGAFE